MTRLAEAVVRRTGLDDGPFNAELFWDRRRDRIWFLELNARASQSHFDLFELVDGRANAEVALDLALGRRPHPARQEGPWPLAAKCFLRAFVDAVVTRVPSPERIAEVEAAVPGTVVRLEVARGQRLSELLDQEPYSYELGHVIVPGRSPRDVSVRFDRVRELLGVELRDVGP
jgi:biotin carboxylase